MYAYGGRLGCTFCSQKQTSRQTRQPWSSFVRASLNTRYVDAEIRELEASFPKGGLTFILPAQTPQDERLGGSFVAVRCLANPIARELVAAVGPITATSANESGDEPRLTSQDAGAELGLMPYAILEGNCPGGLGSTIIKVTDGGDAGRVVTVMREGIVPRHEVVEWWKNRN